MVRRALGLALVALVLLSACDRSATPSVKLDGSARYPDDEGVVTGVTFRRITLDGSRTYAVSPTLRSFSTYTRQLEPMLSREHQYVQIGLDGKTMVWMAGVAAVVPLTPPAVFYVGRVVRVDDQRRAVFADGTVLRLGAGVSVPRGARRVRARIDPGQHRVVELAPS